MKDKNNLPNKRKLSQRKRKQITFPAFEDNTKKSSNYCSQYLFLYLLPFIAGLICAIIWFYSNANVDYLPKSEIDQCNNNRVGLDYKQNQHASYKPKVQAIFISDFLRSRTKLTSSLLEHQRKMEAFMEKRKYPETLYVELKTILGIISSLRNHIRIYENMPRVSGGPSNFISETAEKLGEIEYTKLPELDEQLEKYNTELESSIQEMEYNSEELIKETSCLEKRILSFQLIVKFLKSHGLVINFNDSENSLEQNYLNQIDLDNIFIIYYKLADLYEEFESLSSEFNEDSFFEMMEEIISIHENGLNSTMRELADTVLYNQNILLDETFGSPYFLQDILIRKTIEVNSNELNLLGQIQSFLLAKVESTLMEIKEYDDVKHELYWEIREMIDEQVQHLHLRLAKLRFRSKNIRLTRHVVSAFETQFI